MAKSSASGEDLLRNLIGPKKLEAFNSKKQHGIAGKSLQAKIDRIYASGDAPKSLGGKKRGKGSTAKGTLARSNTGLMGTIRRGIKEIERSTEREMEKHTKGFLQHLGNYKFPGRKR